jgi:hypothetical protein
MVIDKTKLTNSNNLPLTRGLFYETTLEDKTSVVYTLKDKDHKGYPSLKRLYLEEEDLTEYTFATKFLVSFEHWQTLANSTWFKDLAEQWRLELKLKLEARYLAKLAEIAENGGKEGISANKILLERVLKGSTGVKTKKGYGGTGHPWKTHRIASNSDYEGSEGNQAKSDYLRLITNEEAKSG